ncbi:hypothetical protein BV881_21935 [Streptomyces sp. ZL-24]|nr:hypothetical protein BV881_21935 [Streptomyces sp. ZL-24]
MPLPSSVARALQQHTEQCAPIPVTLPWTLRLLPGRRWKPNTGGRGPTTVSLARRLGHSAPGFTLRQYSHFLPRAGARGAAAIDAIFA